MTKRAVLLKALASMPSDVERMLKGADSAERGFAHILHHLLDIETRYLSQFQAVVREQRPTLPALKPDRINGDDIPFEEQIDRFRQARQETLDFLTGLPSGDWQRKAVHETLGETSLRFLVQNLVDSDTHYLSQLVTVRQRLPLAEGLSPVPSRDRPRPTVLDPPLDSEVKNERKRIRKWPRKRTRGD